MLRRAMAAIALGTLAIFASASVALALHAGAIVDCGDAGTFTVKAAETSGPGGQAPKPSSVIVFEEGGSLAILEFSGFNLSYSHAQTGRAQNAVAEVECSYVTGGGALIEVTGILTAK